MTPSVLIFNMLARAMPSNFTQLVAALAVEASGVTLVVRNLEMVTREGVIVAPLSQIAIKTRKARLTHTSAGYFAAAMNASLATICHAASAFFVAVVPIVAFAATITPALPVPTTWLSTRTARAFITTGLPRKSFLAPALS